MSTKLSIVIPFLNEASNVEKTILNFQHTCSDLQNIEIIVVDDGSKNTINKSNLKTIKNEINQGTSISRDLGVQASSSDYILTTDAHVSFDKRGWDKDVIDYIDKFKTSILCFPCKSRTNNGFANHCVGGIKLFDVPNKENILSSFLENKEPVKDVTNVPVILGGAYAFYKPWYNNLNGMKEMKGFGMGETSLSIKSYLFGGDNKLIKNLKIEHIFGEKNYKIDMSKLYYNKMKMALSILPLEYYNAVIALLPQNEYKVEALKWISDDRKEILYQRTQYHDSFTRTFDDYIKEFNLR